MDLQAHVTIDAGAAAFAPGMPIAGRYRLQAMSAWKAEYVNACLEWYTEGRGDQDRAIAVTHFLFLNEAEVPASVSGAFTMMAPALPWSYAGTLIKLNWTLALYAKPVGRGVVAAYQDFVLHPGYATGQA